MRTVAAILAAVVTAGAASDVFAQPRPRVFVSVNGAAQVTKNPFTDRFEFEANRETGTTETQYPIDGGLVVDGSIAVRLWKNLGAGVAVSQFGRDAAAATNSRVPHPFFFEMFREVAGDVDVSRSERGIHVQANYRLPIASGISVTFSAGPSFIRVEQDVVTSIEYDEAFPYDTAAFRRARTSSVSGSAVGFNAGADVAWMFMRHIGIGGLVRFATATVDLDFAENRSKSLDVGGLSAGGGLRIGF